MIKSKHKDLFDSAKNSFLELAKYESTKNKIEDGPKILISFVESLVNFSATIYTIFFIGFIAQKNKINKKDVEMLAKTFCENFEKLVLEKSEDKINESITVEPSDTN